jgi:hypothetical protein
MDYGDVFRKCWLPMLAFNMDWGDIFWKYKFFLLIYLSLWSCFQKCKRLRLNLIMIFANQGCWSSLKVTSYFWTLFRIVIMKVDSLV